MDKKVEEQLNGIAHWQQGQFVDMPKYRKMPPEWKEESRFREKFTVRPSPTGNAIAHAVEHDMAAWIAKRLNRAATLERKIKMFFAGQCSLADLHREIDGE